MPLVSARASQPSALKEKAATIKNVTSGIYALDFRALASAARKIKRPLQLKTLLPGPMPLISARASERSAQKEKAATIKNATAGTCYALRFRAR